MKYSVLQGNTLKVLGCLGEFLIYVSYEYLMVLPLKGRCRVTTSAVSFYIGADTQTIILDTISLEEPLMAPVIATAGLCSTDSLLFENDALDGWS